MLTTTPKVSRRTIGEVGELPHIRGELLQVTDLSSDVVACLGERLRAYYSPLVKDPIPDCFTRILEGMDRKEGMNDNR